MRIAAGHDVVLGAHVLEKRDVLKRSGNTAGRGIMGPHLLSGPPLVGNGAFLGVIKAVDHIEHRALACPIGADDRTDFPFANIKTDIHERVHTAKGQRYGVYFQESFAGLLVGHLANRFLGNIGCMDCVSSLNTQAAAREDS